MSIPRAVNSILVDMLSKKGSLLIYKYERLYFAQLSMFLLVVHLLKVIRTL